MHLDVIEKFGLHFRLLFNWSKSDLWDNDDPRYIYPDYCQRFISILPNGYNTFKLCSVPSSEPYGRQLYNLQTIDGKYLCVDGDEIKTGCRSPFEFILQPNGSVKIRSALNGKFARMSRSNLESSNDKYFTSHENEATTFTLIPHGNQPEWCNVFGDIVGLGRFEHLSKFALPFYLLAMHEERRCYYVNAHEVMRHGSHENPIVFFQEYPNTFTLIGGDHSTGTGYLLHAGNGKFLSVLHRMHHSCFGKCETLSSSSLKISSANGAPDSHFLFDFVPRSVGTFAIRSQENGKFVRYDKCLVDGDFFGTELDDNFPIDAECAEAGAEFITLPIEIEEISDARIKFYCFYFLLKSPPCLPCPAGGGHVPKLTATKSSLISQNQP